MNSEQHKEHVVHVIKELDIKQQNIEKKLQELSIFYITYKEKYDYDYKLAKTFFDNLKNFIENEILGDGELNEHNNYMIINYLHYNNFIEQYVYSIQFVNNGRYCPTPEQYTIDKVERDNHFNFICNYGEERLILRKLMNENKLKCYENLLKLYPESVSEIVPEPVYEPEPEPVSESESESEPVSESDLETGPESGPEPEPESESESESGPKPGPESGFEREKPEIENIMDLYPEKPEIKNIIELSLEKNSMTVGVIFLIMIVFYVITVTTVVLVVNHNHNYNTATMQHICSKNDY
jgi:hypothetical protein